MQANQLDGPNCRPARAQRRNHNARTGTFTPIRVDIASLRLAGTMLRSPPALHLVLTSVDR